jgi:hypothetical protein
MYKGNGHVHKDKFNKVGDFMHGYKPSKGVIRPAEEYRAARRNTAKLSYRIAKSAVKNLDS